MRLHKLQLCLYIGKDLYLLCSIDVLYLFFGLLFKLGESFGCWKTRNKSAQSFSLGHAQYV